MNDILSTQLFSVYALVLIAEALKTLFLGTATSVSRLGPMQFLNQEDADWLGGEAVSADHPTPARLMRAHRNSLENLLPFFIVSSLYVLSNANALAGIIYFITFFVARLMHTYAYLSKKPMLRRNTYSFAWLATILTGVHATFVIASRAFF
jgi:uncharacterized MAPEG superfamily protein